MPGKVLGLDISRDSVSAVQVISGLKGYEIIAFCRVMITEEGLDKAIEAISLQIDIKSDTYSAVIPLEDTSIRNLSMPFSDSKKIRQTLPFEIETMSPFHLDDLILDFNIPDRSKKSEILSISVRKALIAEYLSILSQFEIDPDTLDIQTIPLVSWLLNQPNTPDNGLLLDIGLNNNTMILYQNGKTALIRHAPSSNGLINHPDNENKQTGLPEDLTSEKIESSLQSFCQTVQSTLHSFEWQSRMGNLPEKVFYTGAGALYPGTGKILSEYLNIPAELINVISDKKVSMGHSIASTWKPALMDGALAIAIRESKKNQGFNLRKDEFEAKRSSIGMWKEIRKAAIFIILILIFLIADIGIGYHLLKKENDAADQKLLESFKQTFPDIKVTRYPIQEMRVRINRMKNTTGSIPEIRTDQRVLDLLKDISQRVSENIDVHLNNMVIDMESIRINGETDSFNTVDSLKGGLEKSEYFTNVTISSANLDRAGKQVLFEIKLQRIDL